MRKPTMADRLHGLAIQLLRWARVEDVALGLSAPRLSVLSVLVFGGARTVTELAAAEQVAVPTMTRLLQALEAEGYVRRRRDVRDARVVRITATPQGRRMLQAGRRARLTRIEEVLAAVPTAERAAVGTAVTSLQTALAAVRRSAAAPAATRPDSARASATRRRRRPSR